MNWLTLKTWKQSKRSLVGSNSTWIEQLYCLDLDSLSSYDYKNHDGLLYIAPPVPACGRISEHWRTSRLLVHDSSSSLSVKSVNNTACVDTQCCCFIYQGNEISGKAYLVVWKDESVSYDNVLSSASIKYNHFSNVIWCKRFTTAVGILACILVQPWQSATYA